MTSPETPAATLVVTLEPLGKGSSQVRMTVTNTTSSVQKFCTYHTAFEGIRNDIFIVEDATGVELDYRGKMAKRAPPGPDAFIELQPGAAQTSRVVDLADGYDFARAEYRVRYRGTGISGLDDSAPITLDLR